MKNYIGYPFISLVPPNYPKQMASFPQPEEDSRKIVV